MLYRQTVSPASDCCIQVWCILDSCRVMLLLERCWQLMNPDGLGTLRKPFSMVLEALVLVPHVAGFPAFNTCFSNALIANKSETEGLNREVGVPHET